MVNGRSAPRQTPVRIVIYFLILARLRLGRAWGQRRRRRGCSEGWCCLMQDERDRARARQAQCKPESSAAFGGGAVCHIRRTAVGVAHGRHGSREIIYTFTRHACNNAATAMPGAWTQRPVRDSEKSCDQSAHSAHIGSWCSHAPSCLRPRGSPPALPAGASAAHVRSSCRTIVRSSSTCPAAYRSGTRCDLTKRRDAAVLVRVKAVGVRAAAAPVPAAYRSDTRCDLYVISTCQSRRRLMAHS